MKRTLSAVEARQRFGEILDSVHYRGDEIIIERAGKPMAVVVPPERYRSIELARERFFDLVHKAQERNAGVPAAVIEREVAEAVREVRGKGRATGKRRRAV